MKKALSALLAAVMVLGLAAVMPITAHAATTIEVGTLTAFHNAITNAADGDTIRLTANIDYDGGISIEHKTITLDLSGKTLNVLNGLVVEDGGFLLANPASGQFNVDFVDAEPDSAVYVTNVAYTGDEDACVVAAFGGSEVIVYGNVTSATRGAYAGFGGKITINGTLTASGTYIDLEGTVKTAADYTTPTTKTGYRTYTDGTSTVWVKIPVDDSAYFKLWGKTTTYLKSDFWNWILLIVCFGWIWMAF